MSILALSILKDLPMRRLFTSMRSGNPMCILSSCILVPACSVNHAVPHRAIARCTIGVYNNISIVVANNTVPAMHLAIHSPILLFFVPIPKRNVCVMMNVCLTRKSVSFIIFVC